MMLFRKCIKGFGRTFRSESLSMTKTIPSWRAGRCGLKTLPKSVPIPQQENTSLVEALEIPPESLNSLLRKKSIIRTLDENEMIKTREVLSKFGFHKGAIQECPDLLSIPSAAIENHITIMKESCFAEIRPHLLARYMLIVKRSVKSIRKAGLLLENEDVLRNYFNVLKLPKQIESRILATLPNDPNELTLLELRLLVLAHFLAHILQHDIKITKSLILRYPRTKHRSFSWIMENIEILRSECQFSDKMIIKHGYLIQGNKYNYRNILQNVESLGGKPVKEVIVHRPKILMVSASSLMKTKCLFKEYGIKEESVGKYLEVFTLSPETVASRLKAIDESSQLLPLKNHPRIGRVIYYFSKVKRRLEYLTSLNISGVSLHILSTDQERFSSYMQRGELKTKGQDLVYYIADSLDLSLKDARHALSVHPHWLHVPVFYVKETLMFLHSKFSLDQITRTIPILLYPSHKVEETINSILSNEQSREAEITHPFFLHMVLYYLEKDFHFTGNGIWTSYHQVRHELSEKEDHDSIL